MIPIQAAEKLILDNAPVFTPVKVSLLESDGFALVEDISATEDVPNFNRAMMDGYALRSADTTPVPARLRVIDSIPAGHVSHQTIGPGTAAKIMTGAPVPSGADAVQKIEVCEEPNPDEVEILESISYGRNIAFQGSEYQKGSIVLEKGHVLRPSDLGILATFGFHSVPVSPKPRICLINTGSELVDVRQPPSGGRIRNSNLYSMTSFLTRNGFPCTPMGAVEDSETAIRGMLDSCRDTDIVLLTGGVSMGDFDLVEKVAEDAGYDILLTAIAIKPGKPMVFARREDHILIGLSGNPVSSMVQCARFVLPFLRRISGWKHCDALFFQAALTDGVKHRPDRTSYRPGRLIVKDGMLFCKPIRDKGSADLFAYRHSDCLYTIPVNVAHLTAGDKIQVMLLDGYFPAR